MEFTNLLTDLVQGILWHLNYLHQRSIDDYSLLPFCAKDLNSKFPPCLPTFECQNIFQLIRQQCLGGNCVIIIMNNAK